MEIALFLSNYDTVEIMIMSRYRFWVSVTDRYRFRANVTQSYAT